MLIVTIIMSGNALAMPLNLIPKETIGRFATYFSQMLINKGQIKGKEGLFFNRFAVLVII
jgi:hypothetical protein